MIDFRNKVYRGSGNRLSLYDCRIPAGAKGVVIFMHGFKGFKDWGAWNLFHDFFVSAGFGFVKFNVSHNGGTINDPMDFPDLEAFGRNTYSKELFDLGVIITETHRIIHEELESDFPLFLVGHSRGGGLAVLQAAHDQRINAVVSLSGISDIGSRFPVGDQLEDWRMDGVLYEMNSRTGQQMPLYFSLYEDFEENKTRLDIEKAARSLEVPFLQVHGDMDTSVSINEGQQMAAWTKTSLEIIKGADHTFGSSHPWTAPGMPEDLERAAEKILFFFNKLTSSP